MYGYSVETVSRNKSADGRLAGVKLGRLCIKNAISVSEIAETFGVSRATVYSWFAGEKSPCKGNEEAILAYIASY